MKTKEELSALKEEAKALNEKLSALTDEELTQVTGGAGEGTESCPYWKKAADVNCLNVKLGGKCPHCKLNGDWECDLGYGSFIQKTPIQ